MFDRDAKIDLTSTIKAMRRDDQQQMVFMLENDEIWLQDTARALDVREGDTITIKNSRFFGGYILSTETGISTRVRRIR